MLKYVLTAAGVLVPLLAASVSWARSEDDPDGPIEYRPHPNGPWGPVWGDRVPLGRPDDLPACSAPGEAAPYIEAYGRDLTDDPDTFVPMLLQLAQKESSQMFHRPANNYDDRPEHQRGGAPRITADDVWQWNLGAWLNVGHMAAMGIPGPAGAEDLPENFRPYMLNTRAGLHWPMDMYAQIWRWARRYGATPLEAGQAVHAWQKGSAYGKTMLIEGRDTRRWASAFAKVPVAVRNNINSHLRAAGVAA